MKSQVIPFVSDLPVELSGESDLFGHTDYAEALVCSCLCAPSPFTIGLFSPWGTGKSAVLEETIKRINDGTNSDAVAVNVDVWKYEGVTLQRDIVNSIGTQLDELGATRCGFNVKKHNERLDGDVVTQSSSFEFNGAAFIAAICAAILAAVVVWLSYVIDEGIEVAALGATVAFLITLFAKAFRARDVQVTQKQLRNPDEFARLFQRLLDKGLNRKRLIIGIDNLDRCSPERVVDVLGAIKTLLEPSRPVDVDLVFLIAADDAALLRHLIAQEIASGSDAFDLKSVGEHRDAGLQVEDPDRWSTASPASSSAVSKETVQVTQEYLRKFFNGSLRITSLLDGDIRAFTKIHTRDFAAAHNLKPPQADTLVEMIATNVDQNPRRIKQLINSIQLKLELLNQRRESKKIQMDPDPLVVAKLAVIADVWPERFRELEEDPDKLAKWHLDAATAGVDASDHDWDSFLVNTSQVDAPNLRPYLTLKQREEELRLERYSDFERWLMDGDSGSASTFLKDLAPESRASYQAEVLPILDRTVRRYRASAINVVRVTMEVEELHGCAPEAIQTYLQYPEAKERLSILNPNALLTEARKLDKREQEAIVELLWNAFEEDGKTAIERRASISGALAENEDLAGDWQRLPQILKSESFRRDFSAYVNLAEIHPELVPAEAASDAIAALEPQPDWDIDVPEYRIARSVCGSGESKVTKSQQVEFARIVAKHLAELRGADNEVAYKRVAMDAASVVEKIKVAATPQEVYDLMNSDWPNLGPGYRTPATVFVGAILDAGPRDQGINQAIDWVNRFFDESPDIAVAWSAQNKSESMESQANTRFSYALAESDPASEARKLAELELTAMKRKRAREVLPLAVERALDVHYFQRAAQLVTDRQDFISEEKRVSAIDRILGATNDPGAPDDTVIAVATLPAALLNPAQADSRTNYIVRAALNSQANWESALQTLNVTDGVAGDTAARSLLEGILGQGGDARNVIPQLTYLAGQKDRLDLEQIDRLGAFIMTGIGSALAEQNEQSIQTLCSALSSLQTTPSPAVRKAWVVQLLTHEEGQSSENIRVALLVTADSVTGPTGDARTRIKKRLKSLWSGNDTDQSVARQASGTG